MVRRLRQNVPTGAIWWKKKGGGTMRLKDGRVIKSGDKFQATEYEVFGLTTWLEPLSPLPSQLKPKIEVEPPKFFLRSRGNSWWDVVDVNGNVINDHALRQPQADQLKQELEK